MKKPVHLHCVTVLPVDYPRPHELADLSQVEMTALLSAVSTHNLEAFRQQVPKLLTSELVGLIAESGGQLDVALALDKYGMDDEILLVAAAVLAAMRELDRRLPVPPEAS